MSMAVSFDASLYHALPTHGDAAAKFTDRDRIFSQLAPLLEKYGNKFGVCLVHRHGKLKDGEMMVAEGNITKPRKNVKCYPDRWVATGEPYEFNVEVSDLPPPDLLKEFRDITQAVGVLGLYFIRDRVDANKVRVEWAQGRTNIVDIFPGGYNQGVSSAWVADGGTAIVECACNGCFIADIALTIWSSTNTSPTLRLWYTEGPLRRIYQLRFSDIPINQSDESSYTIQSEGIKHSSNDPTKVAAACTMVNGVIKAMLIFQKDDDSLYYIINSSASLNPVSTGNVRPAIHTGLALIAWTQKSDDNSDEAHWNAYFTNEEGTLYEASKVGNNAWSDPEIVVTRDVCTFDAVGSNIAATSWFDKNGILHKSLLINVKTYETCELSWTKAEGWVKSWTFARPFCSLALAAWLDTSGELVMFGVMGQTAYQMVRTANGTWSDGISFPVAGFSKIGVQVDINNRDNRQLFVFHSDVTRHELMRMKVLSGTPLADPLSDTLLADPKTY